MRCAARRSFLVVRILQDGDTDIFATGRYLDLYRLEDGEVKPERAHGDVRQFADRYADGAAAVTKPTIALTIGDPNGIGPEIAVKAAVRRRARVDPAIVLVGDEFVVRSLCRALRQRFRGCIRSTARSPATAYCSSGRNSLPGACVQARERLGGGRPRHRRLCRRGHPASSNEGHAVRDRRMPAFGNQCQRRRASRFPGYPGLLARSNDLRRGRCIPDAGRRRAAHRSRHVARTAAHSARPDHAGTGRSAQRGRRTRRLTELISSRRASGCSESTLMRARTACSVMTTTESPFPR